MSATKHPSGDHFLWVTSEDEMHALEALGWQVADQRRTHHHFHALLLRWAGKGDPPKLTKEPA